MTWRLSLRAHAVSVHVRMCVCVPVHMCVYVRTRRYAWVPSVTICSGQGLWWNICIGQMLCAVEGTFLLRHNFRSVGHFMLSSTSQHLAFPAQARGLLWLFLRAGLWLLATAITTRSGVC